MVLLRFFNFKTSYIKPHIRERKSVVKAVEYLKIPNIDHDIEPPDDFKDDKLLIDQFNSFNQ